MSIYSKIKSEAPMEPIGKERTPFFKSNINKGSECLMFNDEELFDEGGHSITFYPNGALLSLKDSCKYYPSSKSFVFFNNNGQKVFEMYNSIKVRNEVTHNSEFLPPEKDIKIAIYRGFIQVKEIDLKDGFEEEYFISVETGKKVEDFGKKEENSLTI